MEFGSAAESRLDVYAFMGGNRISAVVDLLIDALANQSTSKRRLPDIIAVLGRSEARSWSTSINRRAGVRQRGRNPS